MRPVWIGHIGVLAVAITALAACAPDEDRLLSDTEASANAAEASALSGPSVRLNQRAGDGQQVIDVAGFSEAEFHRFRDVPASDWAELFVVHAVEDAASAASLPPVLGTYSVEPPVVRFTPRFPLVAGVTYRVRFDAPSLYQRLSLPRPDMAGPIEAAFAIPAPEAIASTVVTGLYPTADVLPMNLLKFYIHFSTPMATGHAYEHIRLIDEQTGEPVAAPFVIMQPELWDPEQKRFTLFFDPGRIKREVGPNREMGPPLQAGRSYRLVVGRDWPDAQGNLLQADFTRTFRVTEADRTMPDVESWQLTAPAAATRDPLRLSFPEPLDHALLQRVLTVHDRAGVRVEGTVAVAGQEKEWSFTPSSPWRAGAYEVRVETILEDVAGNTLRSLFDVDLTSAPASEIREADPFKVLPFLVEAPAPVQ
jgi:hypothetical protein